MFSGDYQHICVYLLFISDIRGLNYILKMELLKYLGSLKTMIVVEGRLARIPEFLTPALALLLVSNLI